MSGRQLHSTGTEWEARVGYSRAVRVGRHVYVSGTLGVGPDGAPPAGAYAQSVAALERIGGALEALGSSLADVEANQHDVGRAHQEAFGNVLPASTMLGVAGFVGPDFLVEIVAEALLPEDAPTAGC